MSYTVHIQNLNIIFSWFLLKSDFNDLILKYSDIKNIIIQNHIWFWDCILKF